MHTYRKELLEAPPSHIRLNLADARLRLHLSQNQLAEKLGVKSLTVSRWERGLTHPSPRLRLKLLELFDMSALDLGTEVPGWRVVSYSPLQPVEYLGEKDVSRRCVWLSDLGWLAWRRGDYAEAQTLLHDSLALAREMADTEQLIGLLQMLGLVAYAQQHYEIATHFFQEGLIWARRSGDVTQSCLMLLNLGKGAIAQGSYDQADLHFKEALALAQKIEKQQEQHKLVSILLAQRGVAARMLGNYSQAEAHLQEGLSLTDQIETPSLTALLLHELGNLWLSVQDLQAAQTSFQTALHILSPLDQEALAWSQFGLARTAAEQDAIYTALQLGETSLATLQSLPTREKAREVEDWLHSLYSHILPGLSVREHKILFLLAQGHSNGEIADKIGLSPTTVATYVSTIYKHLDVANRKQAAEWLKHAHIEKDEREPA